MQGHDQYFIPESQDPAYAEGFGDLSVHEVATSQLNAKRMYFSYYSGGFRVVDIERNKLVEKGHLIADGGSNLWGVEVFQSGGKEYVSEQRANMGEPGVSTDWRPAT